MSRSCWDVCVKCCCCCLSKHEDKLQHPLVSYSSTGVTAGVPLPLSEGIVSPISAMSFHFPQHNTSETEYPPQRKISAWQQSIQMQTLGEHSQNDNQDTSDMPLSSLTLDRAHAPTLKFSLYYDIQQHSLRFHLIRASNLPAKDRSGLSDPFVCIYLDPSREEMYESEIKYKTLDPEFDEYFVFKKLMPSELTFQKLVIRVYDYNKFSTNSFIGAIVLPFQKTDLLGIPMVLKIDESPELAKVASEGDLLLSLTFSPASNKLEGIVFKATNLSKQDVFGSADPYVKVNLVYKGEKLMKWKSEVKKNTRVPIFNEFFEFDITDLELNNITLDVVLMDFDRFTRNDVIGLVHIGKNVEHLSGRKHWSRIMTTPGQPINRWHSLSSATPVATT